MGFIDWNGSAKTQTVQPHELCWATWDFIKNRSNFKEVSQRLFIKRIITLHPNQSLFRGIGDYILKEEDLVQGNSFEDSVAVSRAPIRAINPSSTSSSKQIVLPDSFEIPLRALYSTKIKNLLWAGSHASCEPVVSASLAHPPTLSLMGSAAGHCAAKVYNRQADSLAHFLSPDISKNSEENWKRRITGQENF